MSLFQKQRCKPKSWHYLQRLTDEFICFESSLDPFFLSVFQILTVYEILYLVIWTLSLNISFHIGHPILWLLSLTLILTFRFSQCFCHPPLLFYLANQFDVWWLLHQWFLSFLRHSKLLCWPCSNTTYNTLFSFPHKQLSGLHGQNQGVNILTTFKQQKQGAPSLQEQMKVPCLMLFKTSGCKNQEIKSVLIFCSQPQTFLVQQNLGLLTHDCIYKAADFSYILLCCTSHFTTESYIFWPQNSKCTKQRRSLS